MFKKVLIFILFGMLCGIEVFAQHDAQKKDTTKINHGFVFMQTMKPAFDFDQRFSYIHGTPVNIWGIRGGLLINDKFKAGLGFYTLKQNVKTNKLANTNPPLYATRSLYFGTIYYEPFSFRRKLWEISFPLEAGYGQSYIKWFRQDNAEFYGAKKHDLIPLGASLSLSFKCPPVWGFKPIRWLGINGLAGYRYCLFGKELKTDYNGLFYSVSFTIFFDRVSEDLVLWKKNRAERRSKGYFN